MPAMIKNETQLQRAAERSPIGAVVRDDRNNRLYPVEGVIDGGKSFVVQKTDTVKEFAVDEDGKTLITTRKVTKLKTMNVSGGRRTVTRVL